MQRAKGLPLRHEILHTRSGITASEPELEVQWKHFRHGSRLEATRTGDDVRGSKCYFFSIGVRCKKRNLLSDHKGSKSACRLAEKGRCC